jgi:hypothetical protein
MAAMTARLTAFLPDRPAAVRWLSGESGLRIGRGPECELRLEHASVSRLHAELVRAGEAWRLRDLASKNGSFVNGAAAHDVGIEGHAWLRFGDVHCEFAMLDPAAGEHAARRFSQRELRSQTLGEALGRQTGFSDLLHETVRAIVELAECERGFLLLPAAEGWRVRASHGLDVVALRQRNFGGSVGAVERALVTGAPVVVNDIGADVVLAQRASIASAGLHSLVVLPLRLERELLAVAYADSRRPGAAISEIDLALLQAFGERAALWIAARRGADSAAQLAAHEGLWNEIAHAHRGAAA